MTTTIADLLVIEDLSLTLVGGKEGVGRPIRWAHVSELEDPTPFLRGGEVLLTTGLRLEGSTPEAQAAFITKLAAAKLAGLGFGLGFGFDAVPPAMVDAADALCFPLFEVPYEIPFIAITEALFSRLVNEQYALLQRAGMVQQTLSRLLLEGAGRDALLGAYTRMTGTRALLFDLHGEVMAVAPGATAVIDPEAAWAEVQGRRPEGDGFSQTLLDDEGHRSLVPILVGGCPAGFLVMVRAERAEPFHQVVVHHLATAIALDLSKAQAVAATERRLVGDFLDALLEGELSSDEVRRRLRFLGLGESRPLAVLVGRPSDPAPRDPGKEPDGEARGGAASGSPPDAIETLRRVAEDRLSRRPGRYVCNLHNGAVVALLEAGDLAEARAAGEAVADRARDRGLEVHFGLGAPGTDPRALRRAYQEARFALGTAASAGVQGPVATVDDLGSHRLLLALQEDAALEAFSRGLLGPVRAHDRRQHGDLVQSLRVFLEHNGNWESAARSLAVHRHTLRYRIRRIAELTGRNLDLAVDRVEFWLALRAEEVLAGRRLEGG
jgi:PucR family transcriptional regulator, purine catabolism regulatory protein